MIFQKYLRFITAQNLMNSKFEDKVFHLLPLDKDETRLKGLIKSEIYVYQEQGRIFGFDAICKNEIRTLFVHRSFE